MKMRATLALAVALTGAMPAASQAGEYYLYTPRQVEAPSIPAEGVLVTTVTIRRGDTLTKLARKYAGRGSYFPQILLFNRIGNPDLIYAGDQLRIPVTRPAALSLPARKKREEGGPAQPTRAGRTQVEQRPAATGERALPPPDEAGRDLFDKAVAIYNSGDYRQALDAFELFLKEYPDSPLAASAALYRAESYMQLADRQQTQTK